MGKAVAREIGRVVGRVVGREGAGEGNVAEDGRMPSHIGHDGAEILDANTAEGAAARAARAPAEW